MAWNRRPDGTLVKDLSPTRRLLPLLIERRNEAAVYFDQELDVTETLAFVDEHNRATPDAPMALFHVYMWAVARALHERPQLNRFISGGQIYQRSGVFLSFAAKARKLDDTAALVSIKREVKPGATLPEVSAMLRADITRSRAAGERAEDRELKLAARLPAFAVRWGVRLIRWLDSHNLVPGSFIEHDPFYTSIFVANLGSLGMEAGYHHLYEWGNSPFFAVIGAVRQVGSRRVCTVKYSFDERIDDGLSCARSLELVKQRVEDPRQHTRAHLDLVA